MIGHAATPEEETCEEHCTAAQISGHDMYCEKCDECACEIEED